MQFATQLLFFAGSWLASGAQWPQEPHLPYNSPVDLRVQPALQNVQQQFQQKPAVEQRPELTWRYPVMPVEQRNLAPEFTLRQPAVPETVRVECGEQVVQVLVKKDLMGIGQLILGSDILLGNCPPSEELLDAQVLVFKYPLHSCGSQLRMTEDAFIYQFTLLYTPSAVGGSPIVRTQDASISIECHYPRNQEVSSSPVKPTWVPFIAVEASEESLHFSLTLMTDDWQFERPSAQYLLGDQLNIEASVAQFHHVPLRVFVDHCVATLIPNTNTVPRYTFLDNFGCLMDGVLTGSSSHILPRGRDDKLRIQLEAFRFQQESSGVIYITCSLRATTAAEPVGATSKACSFSRSWREASGFHNQCSCCETSCGSGGAMAQPLGQQWESEKVVGPIGVDQRPLK
ncbi:unnamed protein product [Boreogadus saida]